MPAPRRLLPVTLATLVAGVAALSMPAAEAATAPDNGAIARHYDELGGVIGNLGPAISSDLPTPVRSGAYQVFTAGSIYWSAPTGAWDVHGLIRDNWASLGYENSGLGFPTSDETRIAGRGEQIVYQTFEGGISYYAPAAGAHEVRGAILAEYAALGHEDSVLGFPITNELPAPDRTGRFEVFQGGSIYWSPLTGAHEIQGDIRAKWGAIGYEGSILGYPASDEHDVPGGRQSDFLFGSITWKPSTGAFVSGFLAPISSVNRKGSARIHRAAFDGRGRDVILLLVWLGRGEVAGRAG